MKKTMIMFATILVMLLIVLFSSCVPDVKTYSLIYLSEEGGYIEGEVVQLVTEGTDGTIVTAIPHDGYQFEKWSDGLETAQRQDKEVNSNIQVTAIFSKLTVNIEPIKYTLTYIADEGGYIEGNTTQSVTEGLNSSIVTAVPNEGYRFAQWSDGITTVTRQDKNVTADIKVKAIFVALEKYTLKYEADEGGSIEGLKEQVILEGSSGTVVMAAPSEGYKFVEWSDHQTNPERQDINVTSNKTIKAIFRTLDIYEITYRSDPNHGYFNISDYGYSTFITYKHVREGDDAEPITVYAQEGCEFIGWSDGVSTPTRQDTNITSNKEFVAYFKVNYIILEYEAGEGGHIEGKTRQKVIPDANGIGTGEPVTAVADEGYVFVSWDLYKGQVYDQTRIDSFNRSVKNFASFEKCVNISYGVYNGIGGKIEGEITQLVRKGTDASPVVAIPDEGYVFAGWSDFVLSAERKDTSVTKDIVRTAIFEHSKKTFNYDYIGATSGNNVLTVSIDNDNPKSAIFAVPQKIGYTFDGWFADKNYKIRVTDENGRLMLGHYTVSLETDTLYARWISPNYNAVVFKTLIVIVDEIDAEFTIQNHEDALVDIDYKMTMLEMRICQRVVDRIREYLNEWFEGEVLFEVDMYFTLDTVGSNSFIRYGYNDLWIRGNVLEEISDILCKYGSVLTLFHMGYDKDLVGAAKGSALMKYGSVHLEDFFDFELWENQGWSFDSLFNDENYELDFWAEESALCLHEFTHTVADYYWFSTEQSFHQVLYYEYNISSRKEQLDVIKLYLRNEAIVNGIPIGIPKTFWTEGGDRK